MQGLPEVTHIVVVDGSNLFVQSRIASQGIRMVCDEPTNPAPTLLFGRALARRLRLIQPVDHLLVAWEGRDSTLMRRSLVPSYKTGGVLHDDVLSLVKEWVWLMGGVNVSAAGSEADDIISWVVRTAAYDRLTILSDDGDLLQLVSEKVTQIKLRPGPIQAMTWDLARVEATMGRPEWIPIYKALVGDRSDGVEGVPGIGPARCRKLGDRYGWDLELILGDISVRMHAEQVRRNYLAVNLALPVVESFSPDIEVDPYLLPFVPGDQLDDFYRRCNIDPIDLYGEVTTG